MRSKLCFRFRCMYTNTYVILYTKFGDLFEQSCFRKVHQYESFFSLLNFSYSYFEKDCQKKMCTRQSRKVIRDMIIALFLTTVAVEPTLVGFLQQSQTYHHKHPVPFFQIYLKNSALKTTYNAFRDYRVYFFRQPFSK